VVRYLPSVFSAGVGAERKKNDLLVGLHAYSCAAMALMQRAGMAPCSCSVHPT
jgi:hypothetical protein